MARINDLCKKAKIALKNKYGKRTDKSGYVNWPQENLLPGVTLEQFEAELREGDGNELRMKFCAVHSSAALAVNCFAPFKRGRELRLFGKDGGKITFEKKLKIFDDRRGPNIDVWIERGDEVIAVESKFLEYFEAKEAKFETVYEQLAPPRTEQCWWNVYLQARDGPKQHLDRAQLVKHYFGLKRFRGDAEIPRITLLYIFWEPEDWEKIELCKRHREEVEEFHAAVSSSNVSFEWMTYNQLWEEWRAVPGLVYHAENLRARYAVQLDLD